MRIASNYVNEIQVTQELVRRFESDVEKSDYCWNWMARKGAGGYGRPRVGTISILAHRLSWRIFKGPVPIDRYVLHRCDNPACVNPDHLFLGTQNENMKDAAEKLRLRRGMTHPRAKVTPEQVRLIYKLRQDGTTLEEIGEEFGLNNSTVWNICTGTTWKDEWASHSEGESHA